MRVLQFSLFVLIISSIICYTELNRQKFLSAANQNKKLIQTNDHDSDFSILFSNGEQANFNYGEHVVFQERTDPPVGITDIRFNDPNIASIASSAHLEVDGETSVVYNFRDENEPYTPEYRLPQDNERKQITKFGLYYHDGDSQYFRVFLIKSVQKADNADGETHDSNAQPSHLLVAKLHQADGETHDGETHDGETHDGEHNNANLIFIAISNKTSLARDGELPDGEDQQQNADGENHDGEQHQHDHVMISKNLLKQNVPPADGETHDGEAQDGEAHDGEAHDGEAHPDAQGHVLLNKMNLLQSKTSDGELHDGENHDGENNDGENNDGENNDAAPHPDNNTVDLNTSKISLIQDDSFQIIECDTYNGDEPDENGETNPGVRGVRCHDEDGIEGLIILPWTIE